MRRDPTVDGRARLRWAALGLVSVMVLTTGISVAVAAAETQLSRRYAEVEAVAQQIRQTRAQGAPVLRRGQRGEPVRLLQKALNLATGKGLAVDGVFGRRTALAVQAFQRQWKLAADGVVGSQTWGALLAALESAKPRRHTVAPGETLSGIARRYGRTWQELAAVNGLANPNRIAPGQVIWLPPASAPPSSAPAAGGAATARAVKASKATGSAAAAKETKRTTAAKPSPPPSPPSSRPSSPQREVRAYPAAGDSPRPSGQGVPVALTFNGGPDPDLLPQFLALLNEHRIRATFFFTGEAASAYPELVRRTVEQGHQVENYGWYRKRLPSGSARDLIRQVQRAQAVLRQSSGQSPRYFRPPGAKLEAPVMQAARANGLTVVLWTNVGAEDRPGVTSEQLVKWLQDAVYPGAILMLHADSKSSLEALGQLLPAWRGAGVEFLTLRDLLDRGATWPSFRQNPADGLSAG